MPLLLVCIYNSNQQDNVNLANIAQGESLAIASFATLMSIGIYFTASYQPIYRA